MSRNFRRTLLDNGELAIKGLVSSSIPEPPVEVYVAGALVGRFHGIEVYERAQRTKGFPQTVADIVSNTYFRLTYQRAGNGSATFGTSFVGSYSFRTADNHFHHLPTVSKVELELEPALLVRIFGRFDDLAETITERMYSPAEVHRTAMTLTTTFVALKDIELSRSHRGIDAFRILSISSMYAGPDCYDGNLITWSIADCPNTEFDLRTSDVRGRYLFSGREFASAIGLLKQTGSKGRRNTPGSPDSPSVLARIVQSSLPLEHVGVQAVLVDSTNCDDDSLSIWAEWFEAPPMLGKGQTISSTVECVAFCQAESKLFAELFPSRARGAA